MSAASKIVLGWFLLACTLLLSGCRCSESAVVARLVQKMGTIDRDHAASLEQWETAPVGATFELGDGVRSGMESGASLSLDGGATLRLDPQSLVRFLPNAKPGTVGLAVEVGQAVLDTREQAFRITSRVGVVTIDPQSRIILRESQGTRFDVALGRVRFESDTGETREVSAGKGIEVGIGGVIMETPSATADAGAATDAGPGGESPEKPLRSEGPILAKTTGNGASRRAPGGAWQALAPGETTLLPGTGVQVKGRTVVELQRGSERATLGAGEFVVGVPGGYLVQATRGPVRLSAQGATVEVPGGTIIAKEPNTSADIDVGTARGSLITVHLGRVTVRAREAGEVGAGENGVLSPEGTLVVTGRGPEPPDLVVEGGDSFTVHDPRPPTVVGFRTRGSCPGGAVVTVGQQRWAEGVKTANVQLPTGRHAYEIRCLTPDGPAKVAAGGGTVVIVRDAGTAEIPKTAPTTQVNTDGRRYTVLYQHRLPQISVGWATAPAAASYTLVLSGARSTTIRASAPTHSFAAGALLDGTHSVYFEAATDPPRRSRTTTILVRYDNASPTASISGPADGLFEAGSSVSLAGTALPGWSVLVGGQEIAVDGQQRFRAEVQAPEDQAALPIMFRHPSRGVHYYLRRARH